jgi:hypothetical protein
MTYSRKTPEIIKNTRIVPGGNFQRPIWDQPRYPFENPEQNYNQDYSNLSLSYDYQHQSNNWNPPEQQLQDGPPPLPGAGLVPGVILLPRGARSTPPKSSSNQQKRDRDNNNNRRKDTALVNNSKKNKNISLFFFFSQLPEDLKAMEQRRVDFKKKASATIIEILGKYYKKKRILNKVCSNDFSRN